MVSPSAPYGLTDLPKEVSTSLKLLIVEDESLVAVDLQERLIQLGYEVGAVVDNGTDALLYARTMKFDLVLMDIYIRGETDGIQTAAALREAMDVPVVFLTAHSDEATLDRAALSEPFGYLLKPFDERDLRATLQMAHYRHRAEARLSETLSRLTESNAALEEFASIASHDLQEPLRSMKGCAQLLERKYAGKLDHEADKLIGFIVNGSSRMKSLIEDLLTFRKQVESQSWKPSIQRKRLKKRWLACRPSSWSRKPRSSPKTSPHCALTKDSSSGYFKTWLGMQSSTGRLSPHPGFR